MNYIEENIKQYRKKNEIYGNGAPENLWRRKESQVRRFKKFLDLLDFTNQIILDVGCGYGDFYYFLIENGIVPKQYIGCDLMPEHCRVARERLPTECQIIEGDFLQVSLPKVDIAILSGTLNAEFENWEAVSTSIIDKMWQFSKIGICFNMQSSHGLSGEYKEQVNKYRNIDPAFWVSYAHKKTCRYGLYHDYMHYDYTIGMWKAENEWQESNA